MHARTRAHDARARTQSLVAPLQVQTAWLTTDFVVLPYKDTRDLFILGAVDDILQAWAHPAAVQCRLGAS